MKRFGQWISVAIVAASALTFAVGLAIGEPLVEMFLTAVAIAVSAIPEGLPVVMTIALAVSVRRMAGRNAIIRRLPAVETLGSCTVILSDKTGTLTQNQMTVRSIWTGGIAYRVTGEGLSLEGKIEQDAQALEIREGTPLYLTLLAGLLANEASLRWEDKTMVPQGDPTEVALLVSAAKAGIRKESLLERYRLVDEIPFDPRLKFSATVHSSDEREVTFVKGAPERVVEMCDGQMGNEGRQDLNRDQILDAAQSMAREGQRVLAMAMGEGQEVAKATRNGEPRGLIFLGIQGMMDPPREEAIRAVAACHRAGIRVVMVTGDNPTTAAAIAQTVGIGEGMPDVRTGPELEKMTDEELKEVINQVSVYARVRPSQKLRLVNTLREQGEVIAVTGDGVNDAPALKSAHIGAAMGQSGTDVAKEASEMVLTDDNFASVYAAVEEGRTSFSNIRNATFFLVSSGVGELLSILASLALRLPLPLLPAQILWLNLVTNGVEDVGLAFEPPQEEQFRKPPRDPKEGILSRALLERVLLVGGVMAIGTLSIFAWERADGAEVEYARVAALTTLVMFQVFHVFNSRSEELSVFRKSPLSNRFLFVGTLLAFAVHFGGMYFQPTQLLIRLEPLALDTWIRIIVVSLSVIVVVELHKLFRHVRS
jgi:Ca2+-transporting ATPase